MRYFVLVLLSIVILGGVWLLGSQKSADDVVQKEAQEEISKPRAVINGVEIQIKVARTPEEQMRGLSGRESLAENAGMLFVYETPATPGFWMKDMSLSIDIIWIDANKKIVDVAESLAPETFPQVFYPRSPIQYVLEVNAGWTKSHNVSADDEVILYGIF